MSEQPLLSAMSGIYATLDDTLSWRDIKRAALHLQVLTMLASPHADKRTRAKIILLWRRDRQRL